MQVVIREIETNEIVKCIGTKLDERRAERVARGASININEAEYFVAIEEDL